MTICIAARSGNDHIVVASDRMVTLNIPSTEFEQGVSKTIEVTNNAVAATAGSALAYTPIHINSQFEIKRKNLTELNAIAEVLRLSYVNSRNQKLEQDILSKIGISLRDFYASNRSFAPEIVAQLYQSDISIICQHGIRNLTEDMITKLDKIYDKKSEQERKAVSEIQEQIRELNVKSLDNLT